MPLIRREPEPIMTLLRQIEGAIADGTTAPQACKEPRSQITAQTHYRWRRNMAV